MNRRQLLERFAMLYLESTLSAVAYSNSSKHTAVKRPLFIHAAVHESIMGVLVSSDLSRHEKAVEALRRKHRFFLRVKYGSTNKFKVPFTLELLDYFFNDPDINFIARINNDAYARDRYEQPDPNDDWVRTTGQQLAELIKAGVSMRSPGSAGLSQLIIDISSPGGHDRRRLADYLIAKVKGSEYLTHSIRDLFPIQRLPSGVSRKANDDLSQLSAYLTGALVKIHDPLAENGTALENRSKIGLQRWMIERLNQHTEPMGRGRKVEVLFRGNG